MLSTTFFTTSSPTQADTKKSAAQASATEIVPLAIAKEALEFVNKHMPYGAGNMKSSNSDAKQALSLAIPTNTFIADEAYAALGIQALGGNSKHMSMLALTYLCVRYPTQNQYGFKFFQLADMDHCLVKIVDLKTHQEVAICDPWIREAYTYTKDNYLNSLTKVANELNTDLSKISLQKEAPSEGRSSDGFTTLNKIKVFEAFLSYYYQFGGRDDLAVFGIKPEELADKIKQLQNPSNETKFDTAFTNLLNHKVKYFSGLFGYYTECMSINDYLSYLSTHYPLKAYVLTLALEQYRQALVSGRFVIDNYTYFYTREPRTVINCLKLNKANDKIGAHIVHDKEIAALFQALEKIALESRRHEHESMKVLNTHLTDDFKQTTASTHVMEYMQSFTVKL